MHSNNKAKDVTIK